MKSIIPGWIVLNVFLDKKEYLFLLLVLDIEMISDPLPVSPSMIVFVVDGQYAVNEIDFLVSLAHLGHHPLPVVPDLVVLFVASEQKSDHLEFLVEWFVHSNESVFA